MTLLKTQQDSGAGKSQDEDGDDDTNNESEVDAEESDTEEQAPPITDPILTPVPSNNETNVASQSATTPSSGWSFTDGPSLWESEELLKKFREDTIVSIVFQSLH